MPQQISKHIRSNVVGYVALFFALSGGAAWATHPGGANTISSDDIIDGEIRSWDIRDNHVRTPNLQSGAVNRDKLAKGAVVREKINNGAVDAQKLAGNAVSSPKVLDNSLTGDDIDESTLATVPDAARLGGAPASDYWRIDQGRLVRGPGFYGTGIGGSFPDAEAIFAFGSLRLECNSGPTARVRYENRSSQAQRVITDVSNGATTSEFLGAGQQTDFTAVTGAGAAKRVAYMVGGDAYFDVWMLGTPSGDGCRFFTMRVSRIG